MGTSVHTIINGLNGELARPVKSLHTETLKEKNEANLHVQAVLERHVAEEKKLAANESLSHQGKAQAIKTFATNQTVPALKWMRTEIERRQAKNQHYRTQFLSIDSGLKDPSERMPTFVYLWHKLDMLDPNVRTQRFHQAAEADELKVMAAMLDHPEGPMIDQEIKERMLFERAKRLTPRDYDNYEQNQIVLEFLIMVREWVAGWLFNEIHVDIAVLRTNFGDDIAEMFEQQTTGIPVEA